MQLKNKPRTLRNAASVVKNITATLYDTYFLGAKELRPGPKSRCPDSDIICIAWLLELIGKDSELAGYKMIRTELSDLLPHLPERSRFNRRWRNLCYMSDKLRQILTQSRRENQKAQYPPKFRKLRQKIRRRVETTISQLCDQFSISWIRARTHRSLLTRMNNKFGGFALGVS